MSWQACSPLDERLRFVARVLEGEKMAVLCRDFGISRKTGYKIFQHYKDCGVHGLTDRSRRPYRQASKLPVQLETLIVQVRREHPSWGAPKIREKPPSRPSRTSCSSRPSSTTFVDCYNHERPHEALAMKMPAEAYTPSTRPYRGVPELTYPLHDKDVLVTACGRICMHRKKINISYVLAGQRVGIKEVDEGIWIVSFMQYDLGYIV